MREDHIKVTVIDGVTIRNITPQLAEEEQHARINELAWNLIEFAKNRNKDKRV